MNRPCIQFFLHHIHVPPSSHFVLPFSLVTHIQCKRISDKWCTYWIVLNFFLVGILFHLPPWTTCVNAQISKAVLAAAFEHFSSIAVIIMPSLNIMNHALFYFIKTHGNQLFYYWAPLCRCKWLLYWPPFCLLNTWCKKLRS